MVEDQPSKTPNWTLAKITLTTKKTGRFVTVGGQAEITEA
jgi:hypothetical protein